MNYFEANLELLEQNHGSVFSFLNNFSADSKYTITGSKSGLPVICKAGIALHSRFDPQKEAEQFIKACTGKREKFIVMGLGNGYHLEELAKKFPEKTFYCIEASPDVFCLFLRSRDLKHLLCNPNIQFFIKIHPSELAERAGNLLDCEIIKIRSLTVHEAAFYDRFEIELTKIYRREEINENTLSRFSTIWVRNFFRNLKTISTAGKVSELKDLFRGIPALLLAAGPSLDKIKNSIHELYKTHLIVAVDTASSFLRHWGIEPDFIVVVDPQYWNARHLDRFTTSNAILISESSTYPSVFRKKYNRVFLCSSVFPVGRLWEKETGENGKLAAGGSVSTTALDLIFHLGANEVSIAGLDLGFPDKMTHYKGAFFEHRTLCMGNRLNTNETASLRALYDGDPFYEEDNSGTQVMTDHRLIIYKWWFEGFLRKNPPCPVYNLSNNGVYIEGMLKPDPENSHLKPVVRDKINAIIGNIPGAQDYSGQIGPFADRLQKELLRLQRLAKQGLHLLNIGSENASVKKMEQLNWIDQQLSNAGSREIAGFVLSDIVKTLRNRPQAHDHSGHFGNMTMLYQEIDKACQFHLDLIDRMFLIKNV